MEQSIHGHLNRRFVWYKMNSSTVFLQYNILQRVLFMYLFPLVWIPVQCSSHSCEGESENPLLTNFSGRERWGHRSQQTSEREKKRWGRREGRR
ncbi:hypothetical protein CDAR_274031 [Caerostris darwini]|uniref:Uncharacterized protein n=1 Tax=Caerostris darwini TaxID=1538125 RepID=A0AAV4RHW5_9ARAC|nr:hypothetical protein CDAR_274031 [Caerostris darwini]